MHERLVPQAGEFVAVSGDRRAVAGWCCCWRRAFLRWSRPSWRTCPAPWCATHCAQAIPDQPPRRRWTWRSGALLRGGATDATPASTHSIIRPASDWPVRQAAASPYANAPCPGRGTSPASRRRTSRGSAADRAPMTASGCVRALQRPRWPTCCASAAAPRHLRAFLPRPPGMHDRRSPQLPATLVAKPHPMAGLLLDGSGTAQANAGTATAS